MTDLFDDGLPVIPAIETPRQKAEQAYRDLTNRTYAELAISRAGRGASADDLRAIARIILDVAEARGAK